jgi:integrase
MTNGPQPSPFLQGRLDLAFLKQFFNWCVRNKHLRENPADEIQIEVDRGAPEFFSVTQCRELMKKAQDTDLCGYFALTLFAGIRPEEASRLTWDHINAGTKEISIPLRAFEDQTSSALQRVRQSP